MDVYVDVDVDVYVYVHVCMYIPHQHMVQTWPHAASVSTLP